MFVEYFKLGWGHIISWDAADHILFLFALALGRNFKEWKIVLTLITAFTIGHCATLILGSLNLVNLPSHWIEFLIPLTICLAALANVFIKIQSEILLSPQFFSTLIFGLIHGLGFANGLKSLLGNDESLLLPLLGFNLGVELGQIVAILLFLLLSALSFLLFKINRREWVLFLSGGIFFAAAKMAAERLPF